jgi:hypothetical protein
VNSYTITIAPNDESGNTTTLVVDTSGDEVRITDVHLHAGGGLSGGTLPTVDFGLLLRAVTATGAHQPTIEAAPTAPSPSSDAVPTGARAATPPAARARRRATKTAPEPAATPPARRGRRTAAAPKATKAAARKAASATAEKGERAYRRMPDDFATSYQQIGTAAAIAEHYDVPRYTVNAWIRRIRGTTRPAAE